MKSKTSRSLRRLHPKAIGKLSFSFCFLIANVSVGQETLGKLERTSVSSVNQIRDQVTGNGLLDLLRFEEIRKELKVDDIQKAELDEKFHKIQVLRAELRTKRAQKPFAKVDLTDSDFANSIGQLAKATDDFASAIAEILDPLQVDRLIGIYCQQEGVLAFVNSLVATRIGLSEDSRKKVSDEIRKSLVGNMDFPGKDGAGGKVALNALLNRRKDTEGSIRKILTEEQRTTFESLLGVPFKLQQFSLER